MLTNDQAYEAMFRFLEKHWEDGEKKSDEIAIMLTGMKRGVDGITADPAYGNIWFDIVNDITSE